MGANSRQAAVLQYDDPVRDFQRVQPVRDDERRPPAHEILQGAVDERLALRVILAGELVEDQDGRVAQDSAGQGDALLLATRHLGELADARLVAVGQRRNKVVDERPPRRRLHVLGRGLVGAVSDVGEDRVVKQDRVLGDDADLLAQAAQVDGAQVEAVN